MSDSIFPQIEGNKFNNWCERKIVISESDLKTQKAFRYAARKDLTTAEGSAFFLHELTNCDGFEFVAFSSSKLTNPITLNGNITLVPCFTLGNRISKDDPIGLKTMDMDRRSRFVYDGWLPISDWSEDNVRKSLKEIDKALSSFSLKTGTYFEWLPKYESHDHGSSYQFTEEHLQELENITSKLENIPQEDHYAIYRSIGWLSQSFRLNDPSAKFLFFILTIESLAYYIEKEAKENSSLIQFRADNRTKSERKENMKNCIEQSLSELGKNPIESIKNAYLNCIETGSTQTLKSHIEKLHGKDSETYKLLFEKQSEDMSLYNLRHKIAHGNSYTITESEREKIKNRLWDAERVARGYLLKILKTLFGIEHFSTKFTAEIFVSAGNMVGSKGMKYGGPVHMAILYG
ncbi:hypothetical protein NKOR_06965 [Candidatus Nitrosopumilus koreensis AR1]|uniref:Apea-like HEPN domain-containing protein n=1 Tax=Candidatus Nitrosopumilus koreensis AR1 TaxID=1229908 RepID=K0B6Z1_9ARCH|nr:MULTISPECIES: hypothetical protein [Nitrosopumilus]AFS81264.1 hypothetical protein NKOR_06965 [Candidatus Nitrosopumilus koreensis AR1]